VIRIFLNPEGNRFKSVDAPYDEPTPIIEIRAKVTRKLKPIEASHFNLYVYKGSKGMIVSCA